MIQSKVKLTTMPIDPKLLKNIVEAALLVNGKPQTIKQLAALFEGDTERPDNKAIREALDSLTEDFADRGIELKEVASGFRIQARQSLEPWISRLFQEKAPRYSRALLETLALIAYRQPVTRSDIEQVRGVSVSSYIMKTLLEREWIRVVGHREVPGRPAMYATTKDFLDYFNLKGLDELPTLTEIRDLDKEPEALSLPAMDTSVSTTAEEGNDDESAGSEDVQTEEQPAGNGIVMPEDVSSSGEESLQEISSAKENTESSPAESRLDEAANQAMVAKIDVAEFSDDETAIPASESIH